MDDIYCLVFTNWKAIHTNPYQMAWVHVILAFVPSSMHHTSHLHSFPLKNLSLFIMCECAWNRAKGQIIENASK